ncbi:aspartate/glutamate racemase family protein [Streptomyces sp. NRRL F-5126]|uniref:aspartate/glutamate racemase family protein n=1 Tax=Streptomyces sp. NRRL F-5126 TaxID=1463857 RepID=UPI00056A738E|nr:aspartate/glutamate racemase family protein [Streptomyces sp. NRRL F-5126]
MAAAESAAARIWYQSFTDPEVDAPYFSRLTSHLSGLLGPGYEVVVHGLQPGDRYLHPLSELRCRVQAVRNAITAEREGYAAFVIGHFPDPGLAEIRAAVDIPVIGLGESTMLHACTLGQRIGLVTISPVFIPIHQEQILRYGLQQRVVAVRAVETQVADYNRSFTDRESYEQVRDDFRRQIAPLLDLGVDVIVPAGGYPMMLFCREPGFSVEGAVVLNGLSVAVLAAETAIRLRRLNGTHASRTPGYTLPTGEALDEFLDCTSSHR